MILVTGTGRSGTHYTAVVMQKLGLDIPHEAVGRDGAASWKHIVSGTFEVRKKRVHRVTPISSEGFDTILHQTRAPLKVISSMQTFSAFTWDFMAQFIALERDTPPIRQAMQSYLHWNRLIERRAQWRFQIERLPEVFPEFCERIGIAPQPFPQVDQGSRDSRTKRYQQLGWDDLAAVDRELTERLREMAAEYGYEP
jgi:hypothetical protein